MKSKLILLSVVILVSCQQKPVDSSSKLPLEGTWELISETKIEKTDTTFTPASKSQKMIKILNGTHFSFLRHDLNQGQDSATATFVAGGGSYTLVDSIYTEHLDYFNSREWEGNHFEFTVHIQNDTLIQQGREKVEGTGIDRIIIEKYFRVK